MDPLEYNEGREHPLDAAIDGALSGGLTKGSEKACTGEKEAPRIIREAGERSEPAVGCGAGGEVGQQGDKLGGGSEGGEQGSDAHLPIATIRTVGLEADACPSSEERSVGEGAIANEPERSEEAGGAENGVSGSASGLESAAETLGGQAVDEVAEITVQRLENGRSKLGRIAAPSGGDSRGADEGNNGLNGHGKPSKGKVRPGLEKIAQASDAPRTVMEDLADLPQWQAKYVLHLMEKGGVIALACMASNVSRRSVEDWQARSPAFARACASAVESATDLLEAAGFRGATIGDLQPVYQQGELVGTKRVRSSKDLEIMLKLRGRLKEESGNTTVTNNLRVSLVPDQALADRLASVSDAIFGKVTVIEAETVP